MKKDKLLYVSPFPPQKSGISDYSEVLVYALKDYFDITLLTDKYKLSNEAMYQDFSVLVYSGQEIDFEKYDYIIYNIGNNPQFHSYIYELCLQHPGLVILHDCVLYYLIVGFYEARKTVYSKIYEIGGSDAITVIKRAMRENKKSLRRKELLEYKHIAPLLPLNKELAMSGNKIMVHSDYARKMIEPYVPERKNLRKINLIKQTGSNVTFMSKEKLFSKYHIPMDAFVIASFGYIAQTKLNDLVCDAVSNLSKEIDKKICYVMVGEGNFVNSYIDNKQIFKTGYTDLNEFNSFIKYADVVANLRYPSMGETSAAMIRIMEYGKPSIIVRDAWFSELPEDCVVFLEPQKLGDLAAELKHLITDEDYRNGIGERAKQYVDSYHSEEIICREIKAFLED